MIEDALFSRGLKERRIRQILPPELKDNSKITLKSKAEVRNSNAEIIAASQAESNEPGNSPVEESDLRQQFKELQRFVKELQKLDVMKPGNDRDVFRSKGCTKEQIRKMLDKIDDNAGFRNAYLELVQ